MNNQPRRWVCRVVLLFVFGLMAASARAQGCSQCKDSTAATPPATQAAYRQAILFLGGSAGAIFVATLLILKRHR